MRSLLLICLVPLLWVTAQEQKAPKEEAFEVISVKGEMHYKPKKAFKKELIKKGSRIPAGSRIKMNDGDRLVLKTPMGDRIQLRDKTYTRLAELADGDKTKVMIEMYQGKIKSKVQKLKPNSHFLVKTPVAVAGVRGTEFSMRVAETGETDVLVYEGEVGVQDVEGENEPKSVQAGSAAKVKADGEVKVKAVAGLKKAIANKKAGSKKSTSKKKGPKKGAEKKSSGGGDKKDDGKAKEGDAKKEEKSDDGEKAKEGDKEEGDKESDGEKSDGEKTEEDSEGESDESDSEGEKDDSEPDSDESGEESDETDEPESDEAEETDETESTDDDLVGEEEADFETDEDDLFESADEEIAIEDEIFDELQDTIQEEIQNTVDDELQQVRDEEEAEILEEAQENLDLKFDIESVQ